MPLPGVFGSAAGRTGSTAAMSAAGAEIVLRALGFLGIPYRWGGDDPALGFDCSGLVRHVFAGAFGLQLPRRADEMRFSGRPVERDAWQPGDLLFFNTLRRPFSHVAIYIGDGRIVHAPATGGVVRIEAVDLPYWRARFNGARRIDTPAAVASESGPGFAAGGSAGAPRASGTGGAAASGSAAGQVDVTGAGGTAAEGRAAAARATGTAAAAGAGARAGTGGRSGADADPAALPPGSSAPARSRPPFDDLARP